MTIFFFIEVHSTIISEIKEDFSEALKDHISIRSIFKKVMSTNKCVSVTE